MSRGNFFSEQLYVNENMKGSPQLQIRGGGGRPSGFRKKKEKKIDVKIDFMFLGPPMLGQIVPSAQTI